MLKIRSYILQTKLLCAKAYKVKNQGEYSLRGTDRIGQYANFLLMGNNSVVIQRPVLVRFYRNGEETAFERHRSRVLIDKEQKQLLLN